MLSVKKNESQLGPPLGRRLDRDQDFALRLSLSVRSFPFQPYDDTGIDKVTTELFD